MRFFNWAFAFIRPLNQSLKAWSRYRWWHCSHERAVGFEQVKLRFERKSNVYLHSSVICLVIYMLPISWLAWSLIRYGLWDQYMWNLIWYGFYFLDHWSVVLFSFRSMIKDITLIMLSGVKLFQRKVIFSINFLSLKVGFSTSVN